MISKTPKLKIEQRLYPRVEANLALRVIANGYDFSTTTKNLSCLGAYCRINKYVPPFTKLNIKLNLPIASSGKNESVLECKGVVVRSDDEGDGTFNIAIFFNGIENSQRHKISQYLKQFLPQEPSVASR